MQDPSLTGRSAIYNHCSHIIRALPGCMSDFSINNEPLLEIEEPNTNQMKSNLKVFEYEGKNITFDLGNGDVMVNATEMAKAFGKTPKDYLRTRSANELINAFS